MKKPLTELQKKVLVERLKKAREAKKAKKEEKEKKKEKPEVPTPTTPTPITPPNSDSTAGGVPQEKPSTTYVPPAPELPKPGDEDYDGPVLGQ